MLKLPIGKCFGYSQVDIVYAIKLFKATMLFVPYIDSFFYDIGRDLVPGPYPDNNDWFYF